MEEWQKEQEELAYIEARKVGRLKKIELINEQKAIAASVAFSEDMWADFDENYVENQPRIINIVEKTFDFYKEQTRKFFENHPKMEFLSKYIPSFGKSINTIEYNSEFYFYSISSMVSLNNANNPSLINLDDFSVETDSKFSINTRFGSVSFGPEVLGSGRTAYIIETDFFNTKTYSGIGVNFNKDPKDLLLVTGMTKSVEVPNTSYEIEYNIDMELSIKKTLTSVIAVVGVGLLLYQFGPTILLAGKGLLDVFGKGPLLDPQVSPQGVTIFEFIKNLLPAN
jgi:hypothetical protein